jgi:hypothetical protein
MSDIDEMADIFEEFAKRADHPQAGQYAIAYALLKLSDGQTDNTNAILEASDGLDNIGKVAESIQNIAAMLDLYSCGRTVEKR